MRLGNCELLTALTRFHGDLAKVVNCRVCPECAPGQLFAPHCTHRMSPSPQICHFEENFFFRVSFSLPCEETRLPNAWTGPVPYCSHLIFNPRRRWEWWRFISYMLVASSFLILSLESSYYKHLFPTPFYPKSFISAMHQSNDIQDLRFSIFTYQTFVQPNFLSHVPSNPTHP